MDLALFDFDGTLTTRETFPGFVRTAVPPQRLRIGGALLAPVVAGYRLRLVSGSRVRAAVVRVGLRGMRVDEFERRACAYAQAILPALLRPDAIARLDWHCGRGDTVAIVSGNFDALLRPWCDARGVALIASSLEHRAGVLTGRYAGPQCVGAQKTARVAARFDLRRYARVHA